MKVTLLVIGKTDPEYLKNGVELFSKRLAHYCKFNIETIPDVKNAGNMIKADLMDKECESFLKRIDIRDFVVLLDEKGKGMSSRGLAGFLSKHGVNSSERVVFLIGGAFGVNDALKERANLMLSLSEFTFSHQIIRLFMVEQIYRAFTIVRNENYHND